MSEEIWQNKVRKLHFLAILAPLSETPAPPSEDFWRHPWTTRLLRFETDATIQTRLLLKYFLPQLGCTRPLHFETDPTMQTQSLFKHIFTTALR